MQRTNPGVIPGTKERKNSAQEKAPKYGPKKYPPKEPCKLTNIELPVTSSSYRKVDIGGSLVVIDYDCLRRMLKKSGITPPIIGIGDNGHAPFDFFAWAKGELDKNKRSRSKPAQARLKTLYFIVGRMGMAIKLPKT